MTFLIHHLGALLLYLLAASVLGEILLSRLSVSMADRLEGALLTFLLGFGGIAQVLFVLGLFGGLKAPIILTLLGVLLLTGWRIVAANFVILFTVGRQLGLRRLTVAALVATPAIVLALYPPTGYDATVYHLPFVDHILAAGRLVFVESLRFPVFPQVGEMGFLFGVVLASDVGAKLTQVPMLFLTAGFLVAWGRRSGSPSAGWWAAMIWLGTPLAVWIGSQAYVDVGLACFVTAGLYAWGRWQATEETGWLILSGSFLGFAAGCKYLGLFFFGFLALALGVEAIQRCRVRPMLWFLLAFMLIAGPWYLHIIYHTNNPLFPFYPDLFGSSEWHSQHDQYLEATAPNAPSGVQSILVSHGARVISGLEFLIRVPWTSVFERRVFRFRAPLTPFYLLLLPLVLPLAIPRVPPWYLGLVVVYSLFWLTTVRDLRFLLPVLPVLNLALALGLQVPVNLLCSRFKISLRQVTFAIAFVLLMPGWFYGVYKVVQRGVVPCHPEARESYLQRQIPGYTMLLELHRQPAGAVYGLYTARLRYYAGRPFLGDWFGPYAYKKVARAKEGLRLSQWLRQFGAQYLLVRLGAPRLKLPEDHTFHQNFHLLHQEDGYALYTLITDGEEGLVLGANHLERHF